MTFEIGQYVRVLPNTVMDSSTKERRAAGYCGTIVSIDFGDGFAFDCLYSVVFKGASPWPNGPWADAFYEEELELVSALEQLAEVAE